MRSVHGASAGTLWAVGDVGGSVRITGADGDAPEVTPLDTLTWTGLTGVWAAGDADVWAVGGGGTVRRYTGGPLGWTAERVFDFAGHPMSEAARDAIGRYLTANPRGKHGTIDYRLEDVGVDPAERREALRFYSERFDVESEG
jgi:hypothetical protein